MKIGLVGVGPWGRKLASAFARNGATIVAYDRAGTGEAPYGERMSWNDMIASPRIDAIVAATPPDKTIDIAFACINAAKPALVTKPFMMHTMPELAAPLVVDYVRLWSPSYGILRRVKDIQDVEIDLYGPGHQNISGLRDYGSHVFAMLYDLSGGYTPKVTCADWHLHQGVYSVSGHVGRLTFSARIGCTSPAEAKRRIIVVDDKRRSVIYEELPDKTVRLDLAGSIHIEDPPMALDRMVRDFIQQRTPDPHTLLASIAATRAIEQVEALAP